MFSFVFFKEEFSSKFFKEEISSILSFKEFLKFKEEWKHCSDNSKEIEELYSIKKSKLYLKNHEYKKEILQLSFKNTELTQKLEDEQSKNKALTECIENLKLKMKNEQSLKSKLKISLRKTKHSDLTEILMSDGDSEPFTTKEHCSSHRFSNDIRKTFYTLQGEGNVVACNCSKVVSTVAKHLFHVKLEEGDLSSHSTSLNFSVRQMCSPTCKLQMPLKTLTILPKHVMLRVVRKHIIWNSTLCSLMVNICL